MGKASLCVGQAWGGQEGNEEKLAFLPVHLGHDVQSHLLEHDLGVHLLLVQLLCGES